MGKVFSSSGSFIPRPDRMLRAIRLRRPSTITACSRLTVRKSKSSDRQPDEDPDFSRCGAAYPRARHHGRPRKWNGKHYASQQIEAFEVFLRTAFMQLTYNTAHNIAYIRLRKKSAKVTTLVVSDELNIDLGPDGKVYGIELLNANEQIGTGRLKNLIVENRDSGQKVQLALAV
jgi:uncharacterized protein YuzE